MTLFTELDHPNHDHKLHLRSKGTPYNCNGCHESGLLTRFECDDEQSSSCNYHLHKECALPDDKATHAFHPDCTFEFCAEAESPGKRCSACARIITGCNYYCKDKDLRLHPSCAKLPFTRDECEVILQLHQQVSSKCYRCHQTTLQYQHSSWSYVSTCGKVHLHIACLMEMLMENWEKEYLGPEGGSKKAKKVEDGEMALQAATKSSKLRFVLDNGKKNWKARLDIFIAVIAAASLIRAILRNPIAMLESLSASASSGWLQMK